MGSHLDTVRRLKAERAYDIDDMDDQWGGFGRFGRTPSKSKEDLGRFGRFGRTLAELERRCPDHVELDRWQKAAEDGRRFLATWGEQAEGLGWTARDLFGLAPIPDKPASNYRLLSRYDLTGLIWLLDGRQVVVLTANTAAIENSTGTTMVYRRHNKPAFGPPGDSLDDMR